MNLQNPGYTLAGSGYVDLDSEALAAPPIEHCEAQRR
jgi:hypothetical protein